MSVAQDLGFGVWRIELLDKKSPYPVSGYLVLDEEKWVVETGPSAAHGQIVAALEEAKVGLNEITGILVTHVHLDHSGGAGLLAQACPNAKVYVHPRGARHLVDPSKLESSARAVYGELFDSLFAPILPIPKSKVVVAEPGGKVRLGKDRELHFFDAPGHCLHHLFAWDPKSRGIFSGDAAGMFYAHAWEQYHAALCLPASTPTQFDPKAMAQTAQGMLDLDPKRIYYTHFGHTEEAAEMLKEMLSWLPLYGERAVELYKKEQSEAKVANFMYQEIWKVAQARGIKDESALPGLHFDCNLNAQGVAAYVKFLER